MASQTDRLTTLIDEAEAAIRDEERHEPGANYYAQRPRIERADAALAALRAEAASVEARLARAERNSARLDATELDALSHGLTLLAEMSKLTRDSQLQDDSISVHWHEKDGERAGAAYDVVRKLYDAARATTSEDPR